MKITFRAYSLDSNFTDHKPKSAIYETPNWYKAIPRFLNKEKKFKLSLDAVGNSTIKWCNPFFDSLTAGYFIKLENDIQVELDENGEHFFTWKSGGNGFILTHSKEQISLDSIPAGYSKEPYKFTNNWSIKTPKGYSSLFVHPLNRGDLPFYTLSGFVETDGYNVPVNFPFFIRADFEGIIEAGTPIAQVIPIKRESWTSEVLDFDKNYNLQVSKKFDSIIFRAYKTLFWKRKEYK